MNALVSVVCYKSKTLSNGENPLMLQVTKNDKRNYQSLGISINPKYWDFSKNKPKPKCPNGEYIQKIILDKVSELHQRMLELNTEKKEYTSASLLNSKDSRYKSKTVKQFYEEQIDSLIKEGKCGNKLIYRSSFNSLLKFTKGKLDIPFSDIDLNFLCKYEKWQRAKGNKETTISIMFRTLRSAYNIAIQMKCAHKSDYPFDEYKVSKFVTKTQKRAISKDKVLKFREESKPIDKNEYYQLSKDIFIFSYLCGGINFTDLAQLTKSNIQKGRLQYIRQKTHKPINIGMPEEALKIIDKYAPESKGYLFPILDEKIHKTALQKQYRIHKILAKVNKNLKAIGKQLGLEDKITTYVARHSFATVLKKSGVSIALISEALGHSDLTTTQIYLDSFDNEQIDEAMKNLL
ncbi:MAG: site-specific integrase [Bacteroidaceae bacterium]|nr:site-specific integrase [Lachnospiraceae bacterium]MBR4381055.1 site-specific integrase [Bacteroidaceae bacterium]